MSSEYGHDQIISISGPELRAANTEVDDIIEKSLLSGSPRMALDFGASLIETGYARGIQLARLLFQLDEVWTSFATDDTVEDAVLKDMGVSGRKFREYRDVYKYVLAPHPELAGKPIAGLIDITAAAREGDFTDEDWAELAKAHDRATMLAIRRRASGINTSGGTRVGIQWKRSGDLYAYQEGKEPEHIGFMRPEPATEHGRAAVERLMDGRVIRE
jgi:hypothetical protein